MIRVHVIHDHAVVREAIAEALGHEPGLEVVGLSLDGDEGLAAIAESRPSVIILAAPWGLQYAGIVAWHRQAAPKAKVVLLFTSGPPNVPTATGADAEVDQADGLAELAAAIRAVAG